MMIHSQLRNWNSNSKRIFLRADLNVPLHNGTITNDFRLTSIVPTLDYLLKNNNMVILATHIGRPHGYEKDLSTSILVSWFEKNNYSIYFAPTIPDALSQPFKPKHIVLLENLRFFTGEQTGDPLFAKQLAQLAHYYVNDAFGVIHRTDCSISLLPYEFSENRRSIGFLIEKELKMLNGLLSAPKKPFIAILGGKKIAEKISLIKNMSHMVDKILLCPALCFSFLKAMNKPIGKSLVDDSILSTCKEIIRELDNSHVPLLLPNDYLVAKNSINGPLSYSSNADIQQDEIGISVGPRTVEHFCDEIKKAQTIFFNCAMGFAELPDTRHSTYQLLQAMAQTEGNTIIAGGDTVESAFAAGVEHSIDYISTGGGAALAYLGGNQLPGLVPFAEY